MFQQLLSTLVVSKRCRLFFYEQEGGHGDRHAYPNAYIVRYLCFWPVSGWTVLTRIDYPAHTPPLSA